MLGRNDEPNILRFNFGTDSVFNDSFANIKQGFVPAPAGGNGLLLTNLTNFYLASSTNDLLLAGS